MLYEAPKETSFVFDSLHKLLHAVVLASADTGRVRRSYCPQVNTSTCTKMLFLHQDWLTGCIQPAHADLSSCTVYLMGCHTNIHLLFDISNCEFLLRRFLLSPDSVSYCHHAQLSLTHCRQHMVLNPNPIKSKP